MILRNMMLTVVQKSLIGYMFELLYDRLYECYQCYFLLWMTRLH
jgi:hypothetical protein